MIYIISNNKYDIQFYCFTTNNLKANVKTFHGVGVIFNASNLYLNS